MTVYEAEKISDSLGIEREQRGGIFLLQALRKRKTQCIRHQKEQSMNAVDFIKRGRMNAVGF